MQKKKTSEAIADEIVLLITNGVFLHGERLDEVSLAKRFKVSRTPVRDAFNLLLTRGVLSSRAGRGVQVAEVNPGKLAEMYEAMSEIEALCARLAAHRISMLQRIELEAAHKECHAAAGNDDRNTFLKANDRFHHAIYKATHNTYIERLASEFRRNTAPFRSRRFRSANDLINNVAQHQKIFDAVTGAKSEQAYTDMRGHISEVGRQALTPN
jgi:DNA-binding GntR family transcriptional regulator